MDDGDDDVDDISDDVVDDDVVDDVGKVVGGGATIDMGILLLDVSDTCLMAPSRAGRGTSWWLSARTLGLSWP